ARLEAANHCAGSNLREPFDGRSHSGGISMSLQNRRTLLKTAAGAALCTFAGLSPLAALAQGATTFPSGPVTMVVPFPPGGATDNLARVVATRLSEKWGKPVLVDNRSGGSGMMGAESVSRAKPARHAI